MEVGASRAAVVPGLLASMLMDENEGGREDEEEGGRGGGGGKSFGSKFMVKGMAKAKPLGTTREGGRAGWTTGGQSAEAAAVALVPRVVKEEELLLFDPALEALKKGGREGGISTLGGRSGVGGGGGGGKEGGREGGPMKAVVLESFLARVLRPHQREGVTFLWRCLTGRGDAKRLGRGAILADDMVGAEGGREGGREGATGAAAEMSKPSSHPSFLRPSLPPSLFQGLGKTLQTIALIWLLTKQSPYPQRTGSSSSGSSGDVEKVVVVAPSSLLGQWAAECKKWLAVRPLPSLLPSFHPSAPSISFMNWGPHDEKKSQGKGKLTIPALPPSLPSSLPPPFRSACPSWWSTAPWARP